MPESIALVRRVPHAAQVTLLAAVYFAAAKISLLLAVPPGYATAIWPPSGIALAALLLFGRRLWPGVWLGAALVNFTIARSLIAAVLIGTGNTLEAVAGAVLIRHFMGVPREFRRGEDVAIFLAIAAACPIIAATVGAFPISLSVPQGWGPVFTSWWTWWLGDATGIAFSR